MRPEENEDVCNVCGMNVGGGDDKDDEEMRG